jgi:hypothetical protein
VRRRVARQPCWSATRRRASPPRQALHEPLGSYRVTVPARRTRHVRFNDLKEPHPIPRDTDYASLISSDVPIVVQHTRLDSRQAELALISTMAFPIA